MADQYGNFTIMDLNDGEAAEELNSSIKMATLDVRNRPNVKKPRKVTFEITFTPDEDNYVRIAACTKVAFPSNPPRKTLCSRPDEMGNMRDLNAMGTGQKTLPKDALFPESARVDLSKSETVTTEGGRQ